MKNTNICLACDMGGTGIKYGLVSSGKILDSCEIAAEAQTPLLERLNRLSDEFRTLCRNNGLALEKLSGFGLSFPALVDYRKGKILDNYGKFPGSESLDIHDWSRSALGIPGAVDNDARCALLGEWKQGGARNEQNAVMLTLGTGIGSAAVIDGRILRGSTGRGGSLMGHITINTTGGLCYCGNRGCAEAETSLDSLNSCIRSHRQYGNSPLSREERVDYRALFQACRAGDPCARDGAAAMIENWGALAVSVIHSLDPDTLILGGGVMKSADIIIPALEKYIKTYGRDRAQALRIIPAKLGNHAALAGCEIIIQERINDKE